MIEQAALAAAKGGTAGYAAGGIGGLLLAFKAVQTVESGKAGVQMRWGKLAPTKGPRENIPYKIVGPGRKWRIPGVVGYVEVDCRPQRDSLDEVVIQTAEERLFQVSSNIRWHVRSDGDHPYRSLMSATTPAELRASVVDVCTAGLREAIDGRPQRDLAKIGNIYGDVNDICRGDLLEHGVSLMRLGITVCRVTDIERLGKLLEESGASAAGKLAVVNTVSPDTLQLSTDPNNNGGSISVA